MSQQLTPSSSGIIDLRSDTVTVPTKEMRSAIGQAEVGDDCLHEDPTVNCLEELVAGLFEKDAAVFVPTGTLANQLALRALTRPGFEVVCDSASHIVNAQFGALARYGGITTRTFSTFSGIPDRRDFDEFFRCDRLYGGRTQTLSLEQTSNRRGGLYNSLEDIGEISTLAHDYGLAVHCDGARIWNAAVASGTPLNQYGRVFDTIAVCLSKGLGAPIGSLVVGSSSVISTARELRDELGAGWRQAGLLAAAGIYAIENNFSRLTEDHSHAKKFADVVRRHASADVVISDPPTNIVRIELPARSSGAASIVQQLAHSGILLLATGVRSLRVVFHLGISDVDMDRAAALLVSTLRSDLSSDI